MPKLRLKFREPDFIKWVDSDYSPDWEFYNKEILLDDSRECQSVGLYLTHDETVVAFCQSSDFDKENKCVVHAQTTIPWVAVKGIWKMETSERIFGKCSKSVTKTAKNSRKMAKKSKKALKK